MAPKPSEWLGKVLSYTDFIVYVVLCLVALPQADWVTQYFLLGLLGFVAAFVFPAQEPRIALILLAAPFLFLAADFYNIYYAVSTSFVAAVTLYGPLKHKTDVPAWQFAAGALFGTISALGLTHPYLDMIVQSAPVQAILSHPYGKVAASAGPALILQWTSMMFFLKIAHKSFTEVEVVILSQLLGAVILPALGAIGGSSAGSNSSYVVVLVTVITWLGFWFYEFFTRLPQPMGAKLTLSSSVAVLLSGVLWPVFSSAPSKLISFFQNDVNYVILAAWAVGIASFTTIIALLNKKVSNTIARKGFHFMALALFLPVMIMDPAFLRTSFSFAIAVFCLVEFLRYSRVLGDKVAEWLTKAMNHVTNDRDRAGPLTLSHLYLLVGCGFPLLFSSASAATSLRLDKMAGPMIVLCIGDSFASIVGSKYGKHKWPRSQRSIEGTLAGILTTLLAFYALCTARSINPNWISIGVSTLLAFALEAYTEHIDNLILPVFYFTAISLLG